MDIKKQNRSTKWNKENTKLITLRLGKVHDADILAYLDTLPNKQGYIKSLIRADMVKSDSNN